MVVKIEHDYDKHTEEKKKKTVLYKKWELPSRHCRERGNGKRNDNEHSRHTRSICFAPVFYSTATRACWPTSPGDQPLGYFRPLKPGYRFNSSPGFVISYDSPIPSEKVTCGSEWHTLPAARAVDNYFLILATRACFWLSWQPLIEPVPLERNEFLFLKRGWLGRKRDWEEQVVTYPLIRITANSWVSCLYTVFACLG